MLKNAALSEDTHAKLTGIQASIRSYSPASRTSADVIVRMALEAFESVMQLEEIPEELPWEMKILHWRAWNMKTPGGLPPLRSMGGAK